MRSFFPILPMAGLALVACAGAQYLYAYRGVEAPRTRKLVHTGIGAAALFLPFLHPTDLEALFICLGCAAVLTAAKYGNLFPALHAVPHSLRGVISFAAAVYICYVASERLQSPLLYYLPVAILTVSDSLAAICGKKWPYAGYRIFGAEKTAAGSVVFLLSSLALSVFLIVLFPQKDAASVFSAVIAQAAVIAGLSTAAEAVSPRGLDNLAVPLFSGLALIWLGF